MYLGNKQQIKRLPSSNKIKFTMRSEDEIKVLEHAMYESLNSTYSIKQFVYIRIVSIYFVYYKYLQVNCNYNA